MWTESDLLLTEVYRDLVADAEFKTEKDWDGKVFEDVKVRTKLVPRELDKFNAHFKFFFNQYFTSISSFCFEWFG